MHNHRKTVNTTSVYLGIDLGTTGLKALLVQENGCICGSGYREYPISIPSVGYAEQSPMDWWRALKESLAEALSSSGIRPQEIRGIGLSGQMHGTVMLDSKDRLLYPAVIWCDQRSIEQVNKIRQRIGTQNLGKWVQNPIGVGFQFSTLLWMRENQPKIYEKIRHVLLPKDYIRFLLTGEYGTEPTDACSTLAFNCAERNWSTPMLETFGVDRCVFPNAEHLPTDIQGTLTARAAEELGLKAGIPVAFGGGDQPMQAIGNGILKPGDVSVTLGTGGQIFAPVNQPIYDSQLRTHTFCHAPNDVWYVMGAILNCCLAQNWFFDNVIGTHDFRKMHRLAEEIPVGSDGLFFLPYLTGERTPYMNPQARGMFFGLTLKHNQASMTRAVIEGISYAISNAMNCIEQLDIRIDRLILSGGGARSALWKQILADMLERPIYATTMKEEAGIGAAICAMVGTGVYANLEQACAAIVRYEDGCVEPIEAHSQFYREHKRTFCALYEANRPFFAE